MGLKDLVPEIISPEVIKKLAFIDQLIGRNPNRRIPSPSPLPASRVVRGALSTLTYSGYDIIARIALFRSLPLLTLLARPLAASSPFAANLNVALDPAGRFPIQPPESTDFNAHVPTTHSDSATRSSVTQIILRWSLRTTTKTFV